MHKRFEHHVRWGLFLVICGVGCRTEPIPKPRAYFRIDLPEQTYTTWHAPNSLTAEIPAYAVIRPGRSENRSKWYDLHFPGQRAIVHLTHSTVEDDLFALIEDAHAFKTTHEEKAARILRDRILRPDAHVFGTVFDVDGDVASPMVFYVTDSTDHFLYGALYFNTRPNADSLAPVTERIRADVRHLLSTLEWHGPAK